MDCVLRLPIENIVCMRMWDKNELHWQCSLQFYRNNSTNNCWKWTTSIFWTEHV